MMRQKRKATVSRCEKGLVEFGAILIMIYDQLISARTNKLGNCKLASILVCKGYSEEQDVQRESTVGLAYITYHIYICKYKS